MFLVLDDEWPREWFPQEADFARGFFLWLFDCDLFFSDSTRNSRKARIKLIQKQGVSAIASNEFAFLRKKTR